MNTVCHTIRVKEAGVGGRLYSAIHTSALPNGSVIFLGEKDDKHSEIYKAVEPTTALIAKETPMLVMCPEIIYDETRKANQALGNFINKANKAFPVVPLFKTAYLPCSGVPVNPSFDNSISSNSENGSTKFDIVDNKPQSGHVLFGRITSVRKSSLPVFLAGDGQLFPQAYDLFTVTFNR